MRIDYQIYPTLMDAYSSYLHSEDIWNKYYEESENGPLLEDFIEECLSVESGIFVVHTHSPSPMVGTLAPL